MPPPGSVDPTRPVQIHLLRRQKRKTSMWKKPTCLPPGKDAHKASAPICLVSHQLGTSNKKRVLPSPKISSCLKGLAGSGLLQYSKNIVPSSTEVVYIVPDSDDEDVDMVPDSFTEKVYIVPDSEDEDADIQTNTEAVQIEKEAHSLAMQVQKMPDSLVVQADKKPDSETVESMLTPEQVRAFYKECNGDVIKFMLA